MLYGRDSFYRIEGFSTLGEGMGGQGFMIHLDPDYAKRFYETELNERGHDHLQDHGKRIIVGAGLVESIEDTRNPFVFVENDEGNRTFLLHYLSVPGDACDLGIDGSKMGYWKPFFKGKGGRTEFWVDYTPHNVDSMQQSHALLSAWLAWVGGAEASAIPFE